jgi:hypothetical protein
VDLQLHLALPPDGAGVLRVAAVLDADLLRSAAGAFLERVEARHGDCGKLRQTLEAQILEVCRETAEPER